MDPAIVEILGVRSEVTSLVGMADLIERGLSSRAIDRVKIALALTDEEMASALGVSVKTISRLRTQPKKKLTVNVGDRVFRVVSLFAFASDVLGSREAARQWLRTPQTGLGDRVPLQLLATEAGTREAEDLLGRIEHGVLA